MNTDFILNNIVTDLKLKNISVKNTVSLLEGGATIPFISRYRKEMTDNLDEINVRLISEKLEYYKVLEARKETVINTIKEQGKLTPELEQKIIACTDKTVLEDIYLPYKPKKSTKGTKAKEKGLEPLADFIFKQENNGKTKEEIVSVFIDPAKGVAAYEEAVSGALDIIAENIADNEAIRSWIRHTILSTGKITSKARKEWAEKESKFKTYYNFSEPIKDSPSHRMLAIRRGTKEEVLSWNIEVNEEDFINFIELMVLKQQDFIFHQDLKKAIRNSFKRNLFLSLELEVFNLRMEESEKEAINVFSRNLKNLLLAPPAGNKVIIGVDPGFRTGCKVAVIDSNGDFKEYAAIFPHEPHNKKEAAEKTLVNFISKYNVEIISMGNGTASKETDIFVRDIIKKNKLKARSVVVSEAGASVYSASPAASAEFPELDVTVRGFDIFFNSSFSVPVTTRFINLPP